jgi:hypothetical protein
MRPLPTAEPPAGQRLERRAPHATSPRRRSPPAERITTTSTSAREATLTDETAWVDRLRMAAESHDRRTFERLLEQYTERFPEGQLRPEVDRLRTSFR